MTTSYKLLLIIVINLYVLFAEESDSGKIYRMKEIEVVTQREFNFRQSYQYNPDYQSIMFSRDGMNLIRRGSSLTQDLYLDGFKRNDIAFVLEGEAIQCACPNRMDAPVTRVNIIEMEGFKLARTSSISNTSLYGKIEFQRKELSEKFRLSSILSGNLLSQNDFDAQIMAEGLKTALVARFSYGKPYKDANGSGFDSLYGFSSTPNFNYWSLSLRHSFGDIEAGITTSSSKNVLFPYLRMDERETMFLSGFAKYKNNKIYLNYTSHLMNNGLRKTFSAMEMETDAKNLTIGLTGDFYDITIRSWKADNYILSKMNSMRINNKALPDVIEISVTGNYGYDFDYFYANARLGLAYSGFSDDSTLKIFKNYSSDAIDKRFYVVGALNLSRHFQWTNDFGTSISAEISSTTPGAEQLFISLRRLMQNPDWLGNPELKQPIKGNLRFDFDVADFLNFGVSGNYIWNYINLSADTVPKQKARMTYKNIDAIIASAYLEFRYKWFESQLNFIWGENQTNSEPLAEIAPLSIINTLTFPKFLGIGITVYHQWENAQKRIDHKLMELPSESWNTLGVSLDYEIKPFKFVLGIDNLLNHRFSKFLSTARDPYSAGIRVFDPGRTISIRILMENGF